MGVRILVDTREHALAEALEALEGQAHGFEVVRQQLDVGDVHIVVQGGQGGGQGETGEPHGETGEPETGEHVWLAIERKTGLDFAASVRDGRYHEQKRRLMDAVGHERVAYVLEGRMVNTRRFLEWEDPRVRGCLLSLHIKHRTPVVCTLDATDTAAFIVAAAKQAGLPGAEKVADKVATYETLAVKASSACKRRNLTPKMCFLQQLCQIPGVSVTIANHISEAAGNATCMRQLFEYIDGQPSPAAALRAIPLVGPKTASSILSVLYEG